MSKKMNWWDYWIGHCWMTGWQSIKNNFRMWSDLMTSNYEHYALLKEDDPEAECLDWFWTSLNEDDTYPREFLEYLQELVDRIDRGEEELIEYKTIDDLMDELKEILPDEQE
jgi:hypothetical protein